MDLCRVACEYIAV